MIFCCREGRKITEATYGKEYILQAEMEKPSGNALNIFIFIHFLFYIFMQGAPYYRIVYGCKLRFPGLFRKFKKNELFLVKF